MMITIEQFRSIELKIGTIRAAEPHPNADRLLVLRVDLGGGEERQLVAGIRAHYEPAKLRGVESQGMVLAASEGERVVLLRPDEAVAPGSVVR